MKISLDEFKNQIVADYRLSRRGEAIADCAAQAGVEVSSGGMVSQVALSKFLSESCVYMSERLDVVVALSKDMLSVEQIKSGNVQTMFRQVSEACSEAKACKPGISMVYTIGSDGVLSGNFFNEVIQSTMLPLSIVVWSASARKMVVSLLKVLGVATNYARGIRPANVVVVKGNDYSALCRTFEQQIAFSASQRVMSITIVEEGSDGKSVDEFKEWIVSRGISDAAGLDEEGCL